MSIDSLDKARACAQVLADHNGGDVTILDLRKLGSWTDWFVIATATSTTHMRGMLKYLEEQLGAMGVEMARKPKPADDEEWCLLDAGNCVFHLMSVGARGFYELEKLWFEAEATSVAAIGVPAKE